MNSDTDSLLTGQNEVIIALLARLALGLDQIREIITDRKRDPEAYIQAYNALDGVSRRCTSRQHCPRSQGQHEHRAKAVASLRDRLQCWDKV